MNGDMCPFLLFCFVFILLFWVCFFDSFRCVTAVPTLEPALADFELTEICLRSAGIRSICHHRPARLLVSKMFSHIYIPNTVFSPSIPCAPNTVHFSSPQDPFLLSFLSERSKYPSNINQTCRVSLYDQVPICACYHCFLVYMCLFIDVYTWLCFPGSLISSGSHALFLSPLLAGIPELWGGRFDGDILLRPKCSRVSHPLHNCYLWVSVFLKFVAVGSFSDDGYTRHWNMRLAEYH